jgi:hypothetical protein
MYSLNIPQFIHETKDKNRLESIEYAVVCLANTEDILLNARACKNTDALETYIDFLK